MHLYFFYVLLVFAYLLGSVSNAVIVAKIMRLPDPREHGSGNPGATNVLRTGGKLPGIIVLICDLLKGLVPVGLASLLGYTPYALGFVAFAAVLGHIYPIFFKFRGGKGVATGLGALLVLSWQTACIIAICWLVILALTRTVSLASLAAVSLAPAVNALEGGLAYSLALVFIALLIIVRHQQNIIRLINKNENKL